MTIADIVFIAICIAFQAIGIWTFSGWMAKFFDALRRSRQEKRNLQKFEELMKLLDEMVGQGKTLSEVLPIVQKQAKEEGFVLHDEEQDDKFKPSLN